MITADERLEKIAADFVEHCATRWQSGKSMLVCIDKITCARMLQLIVPRWQAKATEVRATAKTKRGSRRGSNWHDAADRDALDEKRLGSLRPKPTGLTRRSLRSSSARPRTRSPTSRNGAIDIIPHRVPDEARFRHWLTASVWI